MKVVLTTRYRDGGMQMRHVFDELKDQGLNPNIRYYKDHDEITFKVPTVKAQEWINVNDRLPSESDIYWVTVTDTRFERNLVHAFAYDINSKRWANGHLLNSERVIAWMKREVPSPYKGE